MTHGARSTREPGIGATFSCRALLFDLDGVLVDSSAVIERHWKAFAERHRLDAEPLLARVHGRRSADIIRDVAPHLDVQIEARRIDIEQSHDPNGQRAVDGARELLLSLPPVSWAVVTAASRDLAKARIVAAQLPLPAPEALVCAEDVVAGKPDPAPYLEAANRLGVAPRECLVFEDAPDGLAAANAAGMPAVALTTTHTSAQLSATKVVVSSLAGVRAHVAPVSQVLEVVVP